MVCCRHQSVVNTLICRSVHLTEPENWKYELEIDIKARKRLTNKNYQKVHWETTNHNTKNSRRQCSRNRIIGATTFNKSSNRWNGINTQEKLLTNWMKPFHHSVVIQRKISFENQEHKSNVKTKQKSSALFMHHVDTEHEIDFEDTKQTNQLKFSQ